MDSEKTLVLLHISGSCKSSVSPETEVYLKPAHWFCVVLPFLYEGGMAATTPLFIILDANKTM